MLSPLSLIPTELATATMVEPAEEMQVGGTVSLTSGGTYVGTEVREYLVEIDSETTPSFRWSLDGGATFNDSFVTIAAADTAIELSAGVTYLLIR